MADSTKLTWEEMKKSYPEQWLLLVDFEIGHSGEISTGVVLRHGESMESIAMPPTKGTSTAFMYTGESEFVGYRSHADSNGL